MVFPLWDDNSDRTTIPWVNYAIIALNIFLFVVFQRLGTDAGFTYSFSTVPAEIMSGHDVVTPARVIEYAGQTVQIRFRIGTDAAAGAPGWTIDDIAFAGIDNTPFGVVVDEDGVCTP